MSEPLQSEPVPLPAIIEEQEIRGVTGHFPGGDVAGYQWRLRVRIPEGPTQPEKIEWLPWVFGSHQSVQQMLSQWREFLGKHGHRSEKTPPEKSVHSESRASEIKLVKYYECRSIDLPIQGRIEKMTDFIFQARVKGGGDKLEESPRFRMDLETLRQLALSVADAIAVAEGRTPPSSIAQPRH